MEAYRKDIDDLKKLSFTELDFRREILQKIITENSTDPRVAEPIRQQRVINVAITEKLKEMRKAQGIPEPEAQVIGMRSLGLFSRAPGK